MTVLRTQGGKVVAILENGTVYKTVTESEHLLRFPLELRGWAFDSVIVYRAAELRAKWVELFAKDTGITYRCEFAVFFRKSVEIERGHGEQLVLPLRFWDSDQEPEPAQLTLF